MQCPNCKAEALAPVEIEKGLIGAGCSQCEGVLLALIQYRYWVDHYSAKGEDLNSTSANGDEDFVVDDSHNAKICPKCSKLMTKFRMALASENRVDLCGHCDEAWLDRGEWQLLKKLDLADHLPEIFTQAWQKKIRAERQKASWKKHYSELLGEESFIKVEAFKQWLDEQENASDIKHYLSTNFEL